MSAEGNDSIPGNVTTSLTKEGSAFLNKKKIEMDKKENVYIKV